MVINKADLEQLIGSMAFREIAKLQATSAMSTDGGTLRVVFDLSLSRLV